MVLSFSKCQLRHCWLDRLILALHLTSMMEELVVQEGPRILGIGVGLFLLILLWSITVIATLLCSRLSSGMSTALVSLSLLITILLLSIPRNPPVMVPKDKLHQDKTDSTDDEDIVIYDKTIIIRILLIVFFGLTSLGVGCYVIAKRFSQQVYSEVVVTKKYQ